MQILKFFMLALAMGFHSNFLHAQVADGDVASFANIEESFTNLTKDRVDKIKEGSKPFILSQHKLAPTVVMLHGLSDSPGSLKEVAQVYFKLGYNVVTVLLHDHGLLPAYRTEARLKIRIADWRSDIDQLMKVAFSMSDSDKVALVGYSLGGALATDTANRYAGKISSMLLMAPLFKMKYDWAAPVSKPLKKLHYAIKKDVPETNFFYPDFLFNQISEVHSLTKHIKKKIANGKNHNLDGVPKLMFLTDADTTVINDFTYKTAKKIDLPRENIIMYHTIDEDNPVLHRDLPMRLINESQTENPFIDDLLARLEVFLRAL